MTRPPLHTIARFTFMAGLACVARHVPAADLQCPRVDSHTVARDLVAAVDAAVPSDIPLPVAAAGECSEPRLPGSRAKLLPLVPEAHRELIAACARGRTIFRRGVTGFNLSGMIDDAADRPARAAEIQAFFDERAVDVAMGTGFSDGPYPIGFDWVVILDARSHAIYSFVLNCRD